MNHHLLTRLCNRLLHTLSTLASSQSVSSDSDVHVSVFSLIWARGYCYWMFSVILSLGGASEISWNALQIHLFWAAGAAVCSSGAETQREGARRGQAAGGVPGVWGEASCWSGFHFSLQLRRETVLFWGVLDSGIIKMVAVRRCKEIGQTVLIWCSVWAVCLWIKSPAMSMTAAVLMCNSPVSRWDRFDMCHVCLVL